MTHSAILTIVGLFNGAFHAPLSVSHSFKTVTSILRREHCYRKIVSIYERDLIM